MPSSISGIELGLLNTRSNGVQGQPGQGQAGTGIAINTTTGNLVLQQQDQVLVGQGIDTGLIRTYNSQGQYNDDNQDNFRFAFNQRLTDLSGTINTTNSRITRIAGDGSESTFSFDEDNNHYVSTEGTGAYDTLSYDEVSGEWLFTDGSSQQQEIYNWSGGEGHLISRSDTDGNQTSYRYGTNGFVDLIADASGQVMSIVYSGNNATEVRTSSDGVEQRLVRYRYDANNRLTQVSIDLSPDDDSVADGHEYLTQYAYEGDSHRIAQISQSDGSRTAFTYDSAGRIATVTSGDNEVLTYTYENVSDTQSPSTEIIDHPLSTVNLISAESQAEAEYFAVSEAATWASVAQALYGSSDVAAQLEAVLAPLGYELSANTAILSSDLPLQLTHSNTSGSNTVQVSLDSSQLSTSSSNYYAIANGDTWASITQALYGNGDLGSALAEHYDNIPLVSGQTLTALPASLNNTLVSTSAPITVPLDTSSLSGEAVAEPALLWSQDFSNHANGLSALNSQFTVANGLLNVEQTSSGDHWIEGDRLYDLSYPITLSADMSVSAWNGNGDINFGVKNPSSNQVHVGYLVNGRAYAASRQSGSGWQITNLGTVSLNTTYRFEVDVTAEGSTVYIYEDGLSRSDGYQNTASLSWTEAHTTISTYAGGVTAWVDNVVETRTNAPEQEQGEPVFFYTLPDGATPESVAQTLYGTPLVADALLASLSEYGYELVADEVLDFEVVPLSLSYTESTSTPIQGSLNTAQLTMDVSTYYAVNAGDTWASIAQVLYGHAELGTTLSAYFDNRSLVVGERIQASALPATLPFADNSGTEEPLEERLLVQFDFGRHTSAVTDWNTISSSSTTYNNLSAVEGDASGLSLTIRDNFGNSNNSGVRTTSSPYVGEVSGDSLYGNNGNPSAAFELSGLNPAHTYTLDFFASRMGVSDQRQAAYDVVGNSSETAYLDAANNDSEHALVTMTPDADGIIRVTLSAGPDNTNSNGYFYLGALVVTGVSTVTPGIYENSSEPVTYTLQSNLLTTVPSAVDTYYAVQAGDTWESLALILYGTAAVAGQLQAALESDYSLQSGEHITADDLPSLLQSKTSASPVASQTTITDALGYQTTYEFDARGNVVQMHSPAVGGERITTAYHYDAADNLIEMRRGDSVSYYDYDERGNRIEEQDSEGNSALYLYSDDNRLIEKTNFTGRDPDGLAGVQAAGPQISQYVYDANQHLRFSVSAEGRVNEYRYDSEGHLVSSLSYTQAYYTSGDANETALVVWAASQDLTEVQRTDTVYDFRGQVESVTTYAQTDSAGNGVTDGSESTTDFIYDQQGRLLETIAPKGVATTNDNTDYRTTYSYDGMGRLLSTTDALGRVTSTQYLDSDQQIQTTAANGLISTSLFDANGRLISQSQIDSTATPLGTQTISYDAKGNVLTTTDAIGNQTHTFYDGLNQPIASVDAEGALSYTQYDANNNPVQTTVYAIPLSSTQLTALVDAAMNASIDLETLLSDTVATIGDAAQDRTAYNIYNDANQLIYSIDNNRYATQFVYDGEGQLTDTLVYDRPQNLADFIDVVDVNNISPLTQSQDRHSRIFYTADGQVQGTLDAEGYLTENTYDAAGRLIQTMAHAARTAANVRSSGDFSALRDSVSPNQWTDRNTHFFYDGKGQLVATLDAEGYLDELVYDANGNVTEAIRYTNKAMENPANYAGETLAELRPAVASNDRITVTAYSQLNQVLSASERANSTVLTTTAYGYNEVGQLITTITAIATDEARTSRARYDVQGRLIGELAGEGNAALDALINPSQAQIDALWADHGITHTYDLVGRRTTTTDSNGNTHYFYYSDRGQLTHAINALGEVVETTYNDFGEVASTRAYSQRISTDGLVGGEITGELSQRLDAARDDSTDNTMGYEYAAGGNITYVRDAEDYWRQSNASNAFNELESQLTVIEKGQSALPGNLSGVQSALYYDKVGNLTQTIDDTYGLKRQIQSSFTAFGAAFRTIDGNGVEHLYSYDRLGQQKSYSTHVPGVSGITRLALSDYDAFGRVLTQTDGNGNDTTYTYDDANRSLTITTSEGISTTTTTNRHGEVVRIEDGEGNITHYDYDKNGNLTRTIEAVGTAEERITESVVDHTGLTRSTTDANNVVTEFTYDAANRVITSTVDVSGLAIQNQYRYDGQGRTVYSVDANGVLTETQYDRRGQVVATIVDPTSYPSDITRPDNLGTALNLRTEYQYDGRGDILTMTESAGTAEQVTSSYHYDKLGRVIIQTADPEGLAIVTEFSYDANDNVIESTRAAGTADEQTTYFAYDEHQRTTHTIDSLGYVTETIYDDNGNALRSTRYYSALSTTQMASLNGSDRAVETLLTNQQNNVLNRITDFEYDDDNRLVATTVDPDGLAIVTRQTYDDNGNVATQTDASGTVTEFSYDALNRLTHTVFDAAGLSLATSREYDHNGNVIRMTEGANTAEARTVRYHYDAANRLTHTIDPAGVVTAQMMDSSGNVVQTRTYATALTNADINAIDDGAVSIVARLESLGSADDRIMRYGYDSANRQTYRVDADGYATDIQYDDNGNVTRVLQYAHQLNATELTALDNGTELNVERSPQDRISYTRFDALNRPAYAVDSLGFVSENRYSATGQVIETYTYSQPITTTAQFQALSLGTLDIAAVVSQSDTVQTQRYVYDANDRLRFTIDSLNYVTETRYDGLGQASQTIRYSGTVAPSAFTESALVSALLGQAGNDNNQIMQYQFDAAGRTSAQIDPEGATERFSYDDRGNLTRTEDANGGLTYAYYDTANRLIYQVDAAGFVSEFSYNTFGETTAEIRYEQALSIAYNESTLLADIAAQLREPQLSVNADQLTTYTYTKQGLVDTTSHHYQGGSYTEINRYDAFGNRTQYTDRNQHTWDYEYDALGQMTATVSPEVEVAISVTDDNHTTSLERLRSEYDYDAFGNQVVNREAVGLPQQRHTRTVYNTLNQVVRIESPAIEVYNPDFNPFFDTTPYELQTPTLERIYDAFGNMVQEIDANNVSSFHYYDNANRLVSMVDADRALHEFAYDGFGNLIQERTYDTRIIGAHLNSRPGAVANDTYRELNYTFDGNNRTTSVSTPPVTHFSAALAGNNVSPYIELAVVNTMEYDAKGNVVKTTNPRGFSTYQYYDSLGNQILSVDPMGYVTARVFGNNGQVLQETRYAERLSDGTLNALTVETDPLALAQSLASPADDRISETHYDALGWVQAKYQLDVTYHSVDADNGQLQEQTGNVWTRYRHDGNGNVTEINKPLEGPITTTYDALGRQTSMMGSEFDAYVNADLNVSSRATTEFVYDALGNATVQVQLGHTAADNRISRSLFNSAGFKTADIDAEGNRMTYGLDIFGQTIFQQEIVRDVSDQSTAYNTYYFYDNLGRELSTQQIENAGLASEKRYISSENRYNAHGEIEAKGRNGQFQEYYHYDSIGRLFKTNEGNGTPRLYLHDTNGNVVAEVASIDTDLSDITSAEQVSTLDPESVQMTLSFYNARDLLTDVFEAPMDFTGLTTSLSPEESTIPDLVDPDPVVGDRIDVGGLATTTTILSNTSTDSVQFLPPQESSYTIDLPAADYNDISLSNFSYIENGLTVNRTVEILDNGSIRELFETIQADNSRTYLTRITEVTQTNEVTVSPFGTSELAPGTLQFHGGERVEVTNTRHSYHYGLVETAEMTTTISVPFIEGYGDGPTRVVALGNTRNNNGIVFEREFYNESLEESFDWTRTDGQQPGQINRIQIFKGNTLIQDRSIDWSDFDLRTIGSSTKGFATSKVISISGEHPSVDSVRLKINDGAWNAIALEKTSFQGSGSEFIARGLNLNASYGDTYEYEALNADGERVNWVRGVLGGAVSDNAFVVNDTTRVEQVVYEIAADVAPGEIGIKDTPLSQSNETNIIRYGSAPATGITTRYSRPNLQLGTFTEPAQTILLSETAEVDGDTTTTTTRTQVITTIRVVTAEPTASDPYRLKELITTTTDVITQVRVETNGQQTFIDDDIFAIEETTTNGVNTTTTTDTQVETVERFHQIISTTETSNLSHSPQIAEGNPGAVNFSSSGEFSITRSVSDNGFTWDWSYDINYPEIEGYPGDWSYTRSHTENDTNYQRYNNLSLYKGGVLIAQGQVDFGNGPDGTARLAIDSVFVVSDVYSQGVRAEVRLDGGVLQSVDETQYIQGEKVFVKPGLNAAGKDYEVRVYDASNNIVQWYRGSVDGVIGESPEQIYQYDRRESSIHRITSDSDFDHYRQVTNDTSRDQSTYIRRLVYAISSGETQDNIIHRSQTYNAFGEVISETDGRQNTTEIAYDKLGNAILKRAPETSVWGHSSPITPTEHYYYNAQSQLVGTQDANSSVKIDAEKFYNTRVLENGQVKKEFFADGGTKDYRYDRLGNLRETTNQIGLDTRFDYDNKGQLTRTERYNSANLLHSYDEFDYDERGNRIAHENALGNTETYRYDAEGRVVNHTSFEGRQTNYRYNYIASLTNGILGNEQAVGGFETITENARGIETASINDDHTLIDRNTIFGRIVSHKDLGGRDFNYFYNHAGWLQQQTGTTANITEGRGNDQRINYHYYNNGYLKEVNDLANDRHSYFQYDNNGNRIYEYYAEVPFNTGEQSKIPYQVLTAEYDELNRVTRAFEQDRYDITYEYDAVGNRQHMRSDYFDLLRNQNYTQDFYYEYDQMNRFVVTMGTYNETTGEITRGNTGYRIEYNALGQRVSATSALRNADNDPIYRQERYQYDPNGALTQFYLDTSEDNSTGLELRSERVNDELGQMTRYTEFGFREGSNIPEPTRIETYEYDKDSILQFKRDISGGDEHVITENRYFADGTLASSVQHTEIDGLIDLRNNSRITTAYSYEGWDSYKQKTISVSGEQSGVRSWDVGTSTFTYDSNGHTRKVYDHEAKRTYDYTTNHLGQTMKRYQIDIEGNTQKNPIIRRFFYLNGITIGDVGTDEVRSRVDYAQILAERKIAEQRVEGRYVKGPDHGDIGDRVSIVTSADFDQNFQPIGPDYPDHTPGSYVVSTGDTLQAIAQRVWGDAALWYLIADANGLNGDSQLTEGTRLTLPNTITNIHNNSDTFRPYDAGIALGDTSPTLPQPVFEKQCNSFTQLLIIVVAIVVTYYTAGAATKFFGGAANTYAAIGGAAVGAAAGSIASQFVGIALGVQDGFDWAAVAIAGLSAGLTAGIPNVSGFGPANKFVTGAIKGIASNTVGQQINIAVGRQDKFDWQGTAIAGIAGGATTFLPSSVTNTPVAGVLARGAIENVAERLVRGSKAYKARGGFDVGGLLTNAFGNALGNAAAESIDGYFTNRSIMAQYDKAMKERHESTGDAEAKEYYQNQQRIKQFDLMAQERRNSVGDREGMELHALMNLEEPNMVPVSKADVKVIENLDESKFSGGSSITREIAKSLSSDKPVKVNSVSVPKFAINDFIDQLGSIKVLDQIKADFPDKRFGKGIVNYLSFVSLLSSDAAEVNGFIDNVEGLRNSNAIHRLSGLSNIELQNGSLFSDEDVLSRAVNSLQNRADLISLYEGELLRNNNFTDYDRFHRIYNSTRYTGKALENNKDFYANRVLIEFSSSPAINRGYSVDSYNAYQIINAKNLNDSQVDNANRILARDNVMKSIISNVEKTKLKIVPFVKLSKTFFKIENFISSYADDIRDGRLLNTMAGSGLITREELYYFSNKRRENIGETRKAGVDILTDIKFKNKNFNKMKDILGKQQKREIDRNTAKDTGGGFNPQKDIFNDAKSTIKKYLKDYLKKDYLDKI